MSGPTVADVGTANGNESAINGVSTLDNEDSGYDTALQLTIESDNMVQCRDDSEITDESDLASLNTDQYEKLAIETVIWDSWWEDIEEAACRQYWSDLDQIQFEADLYFALKAQFEVVIDRWRHSVL